ncbi:MAG: hypothetical protein IT211_15955 [Armatimonadetes bacterium]|nr:hypothetical protein [Armatimonadota bacterium]
MGISRIITGYDGKGRAPSVPIVPDKVPSWAMIDPSHPNPRKTPPKIRFIEDAHSAGVNPFTGETFTDSEKEAIRQAMDMYLYPEVQDLLSLFDGLLGYSSFSINLSGFFDSVYISKNRNTNSVKFNAHIAGIISLVMPQKSITTPADVFVSTFFAAILLMMLNDGSVDKKSAYLDAVAMTLFLIQILKSENKNISNNLINDLIKILDEIYNLAIKDGTSIIKGDFFVWDIVNGKLYLKDTMEELNIIGKWRR